MGQRGRFKYICEECKAENWLTAKDRNSRFKPHCTACGSLWLKPSSSSSGPKKLSVARTAAKENISRTNAKMGKE